MAVTLRGLLRLKPFDESADKERAAAVYGQKPLLAVLIVLSGGFAFAALLGAFFAPTYAARLLGLGAACSAVTAGVEWQLGLKARALNQLLIAVMVVMAFAWVGLS